MQFRIAIYFKSFGTVCILDLNGGICISLVVKPLSYHSAGQFCSFCACKGGSVYSYMDGYRIRIQGFGRYHSFLTYGIVDGLFNLKRICFSRVAPLTGRGTGRGGGCFMPNGCMHVALPWF